MSWFKSKKSLLGYANKHQKEINRDKSMTYYYKNRDKILEKRRKRYRETGY